MTRRKVFIAFAAAVMILVLTAALFVACDQTKTYTVTFKDGETVVKTASVKDGATIADADLPADPTKDGAVFEGWFDDDKAFDKTAAITGDVTYTAKWTNLFTVTFKDGDAVIATATVKDGEKIAASDIPADLADTQDSAFEGWFNGDSAFDKDAAITASVTYNAKWTGLFNVTFMNGDTQVKSVKVKDGAVISAEDVPGALADTDFAFLGWFVGDAAYDSSAAVTSNIVVNAKFSTFFKSYFGTWHGATSDWDPIAYTVVVDATSINVTIGSADSQVATSIEVDKDGTVMFKLGETDYMLYAYYDGNLHIIDSAEIALSAELAGRVHVSSSDIVGTYTTEGGHTIVINKTFAKVDGVLGTGFYYNAGSGYSWSIGDNYSSLAYDSSAQAWIYKEGTSSDADKLIVPELAAIDIPAEFIGNWYGTFESFGSTSYFLVKVTADGVFAYTPSTGYAKVGVATEYKDGKLTVVGLDETITASIADGKLAYKSDAAYGADYQLEKGTVVVFENNYSVFYIAKLGADNKIDQSTFALEDPQMKAGYTFKGWLSDLDYVTEFDEDATFADSAVFVGSSEKTGYVVTFKKTSSDSDPVIAVVEKSNGKLAADQIPAALTYEDGSVFTGWYTSAGVKATADLAITADTTFIAASVKESDYEGTYVSTESGKEAVLVIADGKVSFGEIANVAYTFNEDGSISYGKWGDGSAKYKFVITTTGIKATYRHLDADGYDFEEDVYELITPKAAGLFTRAAGTYQVNKSDTLVIDANGIITKIGSSSPVYGFLKGTSASKLTVAYKSSKYSSAVNYTGCSYKVKYMVINGKIYVKDATSFVEYYNSDNGSIYEFTRLNGSTEEKLYTYKSAYIATITGTLAKDEIVTISYTDSEGNKSFVAKIDTGKYIVAGAERGTHTGAEGNLVLDGFDKAKIGEADETTYIVGGQGYILIGEKAYVLKDGAYTVLTEKDGYQGSFKLYNGTTTLDLDGFGGVIAKKNSYVYSGTYTVDTSKNEITFADVDEAYSYTYIDGTYSIVESGDVYTGAKNTWVKSGYTVADQIESLKGFYKSADDAHSIEIVKANSKLYVKLDGTVYTAKGNYNNSILTISVGGKSMTITKDGEGIVYAGTDTSISLVSAELTFDVDASKLEGTWELFDYYYYTFTFGTDGKLVVSRVSDYGTTTKTVDYTVTDNLVKFNFYYCDYICTFEGGSLTVLEDNSSIGTARKIAELPVVLDDFAGTWKDGSMSWTFDGKGNVSDEDGKSYAYTITDGKAVFKTSSYTITCTLSGDSISAYYDDGYGEDCFTKSFAKQADGDAFKGTWTYSSGTFVFDGKGTVTVTGSYAGTYTYTVDAAGTTATYYNTAYSETITCKLNSDGSMTVNDQYSEWLNGVKFTKQA